MNLYLHCEIFFSSLTLSVSSCNNLIAFIFDDPWSQTEAVILNPALVTSRTTS